MRVMNKFLLCAALPIFALVLAFVPQRAASGSPQNPGSDPVPAFHAQPPEGSLPPTMGPDLFTDPVIRNAYALAARVKKTLYQQPCYCYCDRSQGHASLLDCFTSKHGSGCGTCIQEALYTYEQSRKGRTAAQIREGIERGEWQSIDLSKYQKPATSAK
jgi:Protein of unknown function with PCYCGC motif